MSAVAGNAASGVRALVTRRWQGIDPLLPGPDAASPGCGASLIAAGPGGLPTAIGTCEHWQGDADSLDLTWGAARRYQLTPEIAGPDVAGDLDRMLSLWRDHLADAVGTNDEDTAAVITWPSRDIEGVATLLRRGLTPLNVVAARARSARTVVRPIDRRSSALMDEHGVRIRRAGPADIDTVVRLGLEVIRFDAHFGGVRERPGTASALRGEAAGLLAGPQPWTWLAERDGAAIGMLAAQRPDAAAWIAPLTAPSPTAYLMLMIVAPGDRRSGIGAALVDALHDEIDSSDVAVTLLHYEQLNPLSLPFWSQQGYRPLWTSWEARPASAIR